MMVRLMVFRWRADDGPLKVILPPQVCVCGGGGGTLIFSHKRRLDLFFGGFKILNFNIFWGFQKNEYFLGVRRFCGYFLGSSVTK